MAKRAQLGTFLQSRRARVQPEDVGIEPLGVRRVPGLRREELAQMAGISVDYYVRLEQGRGANPSAEVLDAIACVLRLADAERAQLYDLAKPSRSRARRPRAQGVRPGIERLLDRLDQVPALVHGRGMDIVAWNRLGAALIADFPSLAPEERNHARFTFLDPRARELYPDWEEVARDTVAYLRRDAGRHPDDPGVVAVVGELSHKSEDFRRWWATHDVREKTHGTKRFRHPVVGELTLGFETFPLADNPDQALVTFAPEPNTPSETALQLLAAWAQPTFASR